MPYMLIFKAVAIFALMVTIAVGVHKYNEHFRDQGRAEVQSKWDEYKASQDKQRAEIILDYTAKLGKAHDDKERSDAAAVARLAVLDAALGNVVNTRAGVRLPAGLLDASTAAANARRTPAANGSGQARTDPIPAGAEAASGVYDESAIAGYIVQSARSYDDAVGLWASCRAREDACRDARAKGTP